MVGEWSFITASCDVVLRFCSVLGLSFRCGASVLMVSHRMEVKLREKTTI